MDKKILYTIFTLIILLIIAFTWEFLSSIGRYAYFDFSLSTTTSSGSVTQGQSAITYVKATLLSGTTQNVQLSISSCPSQITCSLTIKNGNPTFYSTLKVNTTTGTPSHTYKITVKGTGGGKTKYTTWSLVVNPIACTCGSWTNSTCGTGGCISNQRQQTRTCTPTGCTPPDGLGTSRCVNDSSCSLRGIQWFYDSSYPYSSSSATTSINDLKSAIPGTNYIYLDIWVDASGNNVTPRTSMKNEYISAIQKSKERGYKVILRIRHNPSPYSFTPTNFDTWFQSYTQSVVYWANFSNSYNVEILGIGNEFNKWDNETYSTKWQNLISQVRNVYSGKIYYNLNFWDTNELLNQKLSATWLKSLDYIGVSSYWKMCTAAGASTDQLVSNWHSYVGGTNMKGQDIIEQHLKVLSSTHGKPLIITTGLSSADGACLTPWAWTYQTVNLQEQRNWYDAVFKVFSNKTWIYGFVFDGAWQSNPNKRQNSNNIEFTVQGKPTEQVIENCFHNISIGLSC